MKSFFEIYQIAYGKEASDIHLIYGKPVQFRVHGQLEDFDDYKLTEHDIQTLSEEILAQRTKEQLNANFDADFAHDFGNNQRIRANIHYERKRLALTARIIKSQIPSFEQIRLGTFEQSLTQLNNGLILVCGPTGSGKSTTLASMLDHINSSRHCKIITIEDPIEYVFDHKKSVIEQREIGIDSPNFGHALRTIFRQDPNIIMVGEMRDKETIQETLRIAETGHLVFSTLHTSSAPATMLRIVDIFEPHEQRQIKIQLAENLRAVIFQQLVPCVPDGRVAAREILINNSAVANIIRTGNFEQLDTVLQTSSEEGMITMEHALETLYRDKLITKEIYDKGRGHARQYAYF